MYDHFPTIVHDLLKGKVTFFLNIDRHQHFYYAI